MNRLKTLACMMLTALVAMTMGACGSDCQDGQEERAEEKKDAVIRFFLTMGDNSPMTRDDNKWGTQSYTGNGGDPANGNPEEDEGTLFDNSYDPSSIQVLFYDTNNNFLCEVQQMDFHRVEYASAKYNDFEYCGRVPIKDFPIVAGNNYKLVVLANFPHRVGTHSLFTALNSETFTWDKPGSNQRNVTYIPLCGVSTQPLNLVPGQMTTLQQKVFLLRAVSKVELRLLPHLITDGYKLVNATITNGNSSGYCLPLTMTEKPKTTDIVREDAKRPLASAITDITPQFQDNSVITFYTPEYDNTTDPTTAAAITVTVRNKYEREKTFTRGIEFKYYPGYNYGGVQYTNLIGQHFDLVRNHEYIYEINSANFDEGLRFTVTIADMEKGGEYSYVY